MSVVSTARPMTSFLIDDILQGTHDLNKVPADTPAVVTTGFPRYCFPPVFSQGSSTSSNHDDEDSSDEIDITDNSDQSYSAPVENRKTRPSFAPYKVARLKSIFVQKNYLSKQERRHLALELDMAEEQVKTWFQNKRTKLKKKMAQQDEHYAKLLYLNDLINGTDDRHNELQSPPPYSFHRYPIAGYPILDRSPDIIEKQIPCNFPYITNY